MENPRAFGWIITHSELRFFFSFFSGSGGEGGLGGTASKHTNAHIIKIPI